VHYKQDAAAFAVSVITPPYVHFGSAVDVESIRPYELCPGTILGIEPRTGRDEVEALKVGLLHARRRYPAVPFVLRLQRDVGIDAAYLIQVAAQLRVRAVIVEGDPIRDTLCRFLTSPIDLATDVVEWLSLRRPTLPPQLTDLIRKIFAHAPARGAEQQLFSEIGESTRTARARCRKLALPPPSAWLQVARGIDAALSLQRTRSTPLLDLAVDLGYSDHSALSHQLMRMFGTPPSVIREMLGWEWLLESWLCRWSERLAAQA
jgi:AraC-like DNA-binding protein